LENPSINGDKGAVGAAGDGAGGGIYSFGSILSILQSTISGNTAAGDGGGVAGIENSSTEIHNATIAKNTAGRSGGGLFVVPDGAASAVNVISTIIAMNNAGKNQARDVSGIIQASYSLIQNVDGAGLGLNFLNITGIDPKLGSLGGTGPAVMVPTAKSPVINKGFNPDGLLKDQRGNNRKLGIAVDIGAVEVA
jgi:hypothetical protein